MTTNAEIYARHFDASLASARKQPADTRRTQYIVRLTAVPFYAAAHLQWTGERFYALAFDFATTATAYAVDLGFKLDEFEIEAF